VSIEGLIAFKKKKSGREIKWKRLIEREIQPLDFDETEKEKVVGFGDRLKEDGWFSPIFLSEKWDLLQISRFDPNISLEIIERTQ
jgi:hypothetical protein